LSGFPADTLAPPDFVSDQLARFDFTGPFQQDGVSWHCELCTLAHIAAETGQHELQQFLEVTPCEAEHSFDIRVGLMLDRIDAAAIHKTIIMIRQYKNIAVGLHRYGEVYRLR